MLLRPNINWTANLNIELPSVLAETETLPDHFSVAFTVEEPSDCFRSEVKENNGHSWEDSCVEIFLQNPTNPEEYFNFEITSRGFMLAAKGKDRNNRTPIPQADADKVIRTKQIASVAGNLICWGMTVQIPASVLGLKSFDGIKLKGNLYKCGDLAKTPHYLSAFPIDTEKPDFHRPEFFKEF